MSTTHPSDESGKVSGALRVHSKLKRIFQENLPIGISRYRNPMIYTSWIIAFNPNENSYTIGKFLDDSADDNFSAGTVVELSAFVEGVRATWQGTIKSQSTLSDGQAGYTLEIPEHLNYLQRRAFFRVKPRPKQVVEIEAKAEGKPLPDLKLHDISISGLSIEAPADVRDSGLVSGAEIKCVLTKPGYQIPFLATVVFIDGTDRRVNIRCALKRQSREVENAMSRLVAELQIEQLREDKERGLRL